MISDLTPTGPTRSSQARDELRDRLVEVIRHVRDRRRVTEERWHRNLDAFKGVRNRSYFVSAWNHYVPMARRAVERRVTRVVQALFPASRFFEVFPAEEGIEDTAADAVRAFQHFVMTKRLNIRRLVTQWARCMDLYERAIGKVSVEIVNATIEYGSAKGQLDEVWPTIRVVDPFDFYVWPETITRIEDAQLVVEDVIMPYADYLEAVELGVAAKIERGALRAVTWPEHITRRLATEGMADPSSTGALGGVAAAATMGREAFVQMSEVFARTPQGFLHVWLVWNVEGGVRMTRHHKAAFVIPPYRMALARPVPGEHYSTSVMDDIETLQVLLNDQFNQAEEARTIASLPPVRMHGESRTQQFVYGPRRIWHTNSPESGSPVPIPDTSQGSHRALQLTMMLMQQTGGSNPSTEGAPTRGLPRAATAVTSLLQLAMADIKETAMILEHELLTPLLGDLHRVTLAFVPASQRFAVPGTMDYGARTVSLEDLAGNWHFEWMATASMDDMRSKLDGYLRVVEMFAKAQPVLAQAGVQPNWPYMFRKLWREALGERGMSQALVPLPPPVAPPEGAGVPPEGAAPPGGPPGAAPPGAPPPGAPPGAIDPKMLLEMARLGVLPSPGALPRS